jgi:antitoxin component YwqK of YwqJK toxin-antitoxin module
MLSMFPRPAALAAALLALLPLGAQAVQDCELNGQSVNPANGNTTAGKTGLMRCKDRDSGELMREQQLQNGVFMGPVRTYEKGKLLKEHSVNARGNMEGPAREFSPATGRVLREAVYDNGHETGVTRSFHPNGQLRRATFYAEPGERAYAEFTERGQLSGLRCGDKPLLAPAADDARLCGFVGSTPSQVELFDGKGILRTRLAYLAGKRVRSEELYDNGKPSMQDEISGTQRIERRWSSEGIKRREIVYLLLERGAIKRREQEFSEKGLLVRDQRWSAAGEPLSDESYYLNGQPRSKAVYGEGNEARTVEITEFHDNGERAALGRFAVVSRFRQIPIGLHQRFNDSGKLRAESSYDDKGRVTRERSWDADGKLERDDEVFEDGSRKAYAR